MNRLTKNRSALVVFVLTAVCGVGQATAQLMRAPELSGISFKQVQSSAMRMASFPGKPVVSLATQQLVLTDFLGQKGGVLEKLYSEAGRKELAERIGQALRAEKDSAYFIFEVPDFSKAILITAYVKEDGSLRGRADFVARSKKATDACSEKTMKAATVDYRADACYYNQWERSNEYEGVTYPSVEYSSVSDFVSTVKGMAEQFRPITPIFTFLEQQPALNAEYKKLAKTFRTMKLAHFLGLAVLNEAGWSKNLSSASGWDKGQAALSGDQVKVLAGIRQLFSDNKTYLSSNVRCDARPMPGSSIVDNALVSDDCVPTTLMGEHVQQFYEAMQKAGYSYEEASHTWRK